MEQTRRDFIKSCAALGAVAAISISSIGCKKDDGGDDPDAGPACAFTIDNNGNIVVNLDECGELLSDNRAIRLEDTPLGRRMLVTHTSGDNYFALDSRCTHQGCGVAASTPTLNCPCHGSRYNLTGTVNRGPATSALRDFSLSKQGNNLIISI